MAITRIGNDLLGRRWTQSFGRGLWNSGRLMLRKGGRVVAGAGTQGVRGIVAGARTAGNAIVNHPLFGVPATGVAGYAAYQLPKRLRVNLLHSNPDYDFTEAGIFSNDYKHPDNEDAYKKIPIYL